MGAQWTHKTFQMLDLGAPCWPRNKANTRGKIRVMKTNKQTKPNKMSDCFTSSSPSPRSSYEIRSATSPAILKFFLFLLSVRGNSEQFSWHRLTPYPLLDLLWSCFGMIHFLLSQRGERIPQTGLFSLLCSVFQRWCNSLCNALLPQ